VSKDTSADTSRLRVRRMRLYQTNNADVVGAINVLKAGYARFACEVNRNGGQQQYLAGRGRDPPSLGGGRMSTSS